MLETNSINEINLEEDRSNNSKTQFKMENKTKEQLLQELFKIKRSALEVEASETLNKSQKSMNLRHLRKFRREIEAAIKDKVLSEEETKYEEDQTKSLAEKQQRIEAAKAKNTAEKGKDTLKLND